MDVPFASSGAMSRAHYTLVRKVENAASPHAADQILLKELDVIRHNLQQPHLSIKECKECLVLILYCTMSLSTAGPGDLGFAFPHAVNLAELGQSPLDRKIGYVFCMELMPPNHELHLMLVNTLRKDLESDTVPRICLALDVLTQVPNEDVIPAVDTRLQILIHHHSITVRRRALMAYYTLFQRDIERLTRLEDVIQRRLRGQPSEIVSMSTIAGKLKHSRSLEKLLNFQLQQRYHESSESNFMCSILRTLRRGEMKLEAGSVPIVFDVIKHASKLPMRAVIQDAFMLLSTLSPEVLRQTQSSSLAVISIRHFLSSRDPNDLHLFVSCLAYLDPSIWAGTHHDTVAVLDEWEVEGVMKLLDSPDGLIRKMTLKILHSVDPMIVETYYLQALQNLSPHLSLSDKNEAILRLLEVIDLQDADDIDQYARRLKDLFSVIEGEAHGSTEYLPVLDLSIERILNGIRERETSCRISCVTALAVCLTEREVRVGPTLMVVISALVSEYCGKISISPAEMLRGIATRLGSYGPSVQDACLLTMLRLAAECDEIPEEVMAAVHRMSQHTGTYLRKRCEQFLSLSSQRRILADIVSGAPSSSLPDFVLALTSYQSHTPSQSPRTTSSGRQDLLDLSPFRGTTVARKLRYEAYDAAPDPVASSRYLSSPRRSKGPVSSPEGGTRSLSRTSHTSSSLNELGKTITPGELTLAAAQSPFDASEVKRKVQLSPGDIAPGADLIALDSVFVSKPAKAQDDFKVAWESMEKANVRGWCEGSLDEIVRLLQSLQYRMRVIGTDEPPFEGELKILVEGAEPGERATLRLREGDDESCLWRLRCEDVGLRSLIKRSMEVSK